LKKARLVVNINPTCSRERASWITGKEDGLIPLHKDLDTTTKNLKGKQMHPIKVERRRYASTVERMDMWRKYATRREMISRRRLNALKETCLLFADPLIISLSKLELLIACRIS
jgi:hypothetical protein